MGVTVGFASVEENPGGSEVHWYVLPATEGAPIEILSPEQISVFSITAATGFSTTVINTLSVSSKVTPLTTVVTVNSNSVGWSGETVGAYGGERLTKLDPPSPRSNGDDVHV